MKRPKGTKIHTNVVYSSNVHGEAFKVIRSSGHLRWPANTKARIHPQGRLRRSYVATEGET